MRVGEGRTPVTYKAWWLCLVQAQMGADFLAPFSCLRVYLPDSSRSHTPVVRRSHVRGIMTLSYIVPCFCVSPCIRIQSRPCHLLRNGPLPLLELHFSLHLSHLMAGPLPLSPLCICSSFFIPELPSYPSSSKVLFCFYFSHAGSRHMVCVFWGSSFSSSYLLVPVIQNEWLITVCCYSSLLQILLLLGFSVHPCPQPLLWCLSSFHISLPLNRCRLFKGFLLSVASLSFHECWMNPSLDLVFSFLARTLQHYYKWKQFDFICVNWISVPPTALWNLFLCIVMQLKGKFCSVQGFAGFRSPAFGDLQGNRILWVTGFKLSLTP